MEKCIAYICNPTSVHDAKWINHFSQSYKVIVLCSTSYDLEQSLINNDVEVLNVLPASYPLLNFIKRSKAKAQLKSVLRKHNVKLIHSMYAVPNCLWAVDIGFNNHFITTRGSDVLIEYTNGFFPKDGYLNSFRSYLMTNKFERAFQTARFISSTSKAQNNKITKISDVAPNKVIPTGVDHLKFESSSSEHRDNIIFCPRAMRPLYNIDVVITAFEQFNKDGNHKLRLIDDGEDEYYALEMRQMVKDKDLSDKVEFLDQLSQDQMIDAYKSSCLIVMIPDSDGTPNSGVEAMLCKKPLIMGLAKYDDDIFSRDYVVRLRSNSINALKEALNKHFSQDDAIIKKQLETAYNRTIEKASLQSSLDKVLEIYKRLL
jgi:glycosyltransferase involved in cell wall biosynthesis